MAKIAIDAGHGLYTAGKRCLKSLDPNETREWVLNNRVASALDAYLKGAGHETLRVDDTDGSTDVSLAERVRRAEAWGADYYISIHHNAGINGGSGGGTVMYKYNGTSGKTKTTQEAIYKHAIAEAGLKGNRSDGTLDGDFHVIRETSMPAGLIECGFMDSSTDIKYILDENWSKKIALGIAKGICEVWGGTVKATTTSATTNSTSGSSVTVDPAKSKNASYSRTWTVNSADGLNMRAGANTSKKLITTVPNGAKVRCYGYYTKESDGTIWLLVQYGSYTGFMSKGYLK